MFLIATLYVGPSGTPVRVRNLSKSGALIEGADLPPGGTEITLRRGYLETTGSVAWAAAGRAGLAFRWPVAVSAWLPAKEPFRQAQIDRIAFGAKHAACAVEISPCPLVDEAPLSMSALIAELAALQAELGQLGDKLCEDMTLVAAHPEIQFLDSAGQRIAKVVEALHTAQG